MKFYSPLRYPGGKSKLSQFVGQICIDNHIDGHYIEPYAGGASVALYLLMEGQVSRITINDFDRSIYAFWYSILKHTNFFCEMIMDTDVSIDNWLKFKLIQKNKNKEPLFSLGFSTFFLNRTNISGIIDAGAIGGFQQSGKYKIDCRFNKLALLSRIKEIAKKKKQINLYNLDALELVDKIQKEQENSNAIFYFDPPYFLKGPSLYINSYESEDHLKVSERIKKIDNAHWIVSYDNVREIKEMYSECEMNEYSLSYTAGAKKRGSEILFFSPHLLVPDLQSFVR